MADPLFDGGYVQRHMILGCFMAIFEQMLLHLSTEHYQITLSRAFCSDHLHALSFDLVSTMFTTNRDVTMGTVTSGASLTVFDYRSAPSSVDIASGLLAVVSRA